MKRKLRLSVLVGAVLLCALTAQFAPAQTPITFSKAFSPSEIGPGSVSTLQFFISSSSIGARDLAFTDNLPAGVTVANPLSITNTCGGSITASAGGSSISFADGQIGAGSSCTISVNVTSSTPGTHTNTSGPLTSSAGNSGTASANLTVSTDRPGFLKSFSPSSVFLGGRSTMTLTVDNSANPNQAIRLTFTDSLPTGMVIASPANASTTCGGGSLSAPAGGSTISYGPLLPTGASVAANSTCTIRVDVVANGGGTLVNTTGDLSSIPPTGFPTRSSGKASAGLTATVQQLSLSKSFTNDPVAPGDTVNLRFTVRNLDRRDDAISISFTDDLDATLSGLTAVSLPSNPCGAGSSITGSSVLTLNNGSLAVGASCIFNVTLQVPSGATPGTYTNTTGAVTADIGGNSVTGNAATDILVVSGLPVLAKTFLDNPVGAGGTTELEFTITNNSSSTATDISFQDVFATILPTASVVPSAGFCNGTGSVTFQPLINPAPPGDSIPATLTISGAELGPGESCTLSITLDVLVGAQVGTYPNTTSEITATIDGETVTGNAASDDLLVVSAPTLEKVFLNDPVAAGSTVELEFTITMPGGESAVGSTDDITFSDNLTAVLAGLEAIDTPKTNVCGAGSEISGTTNLTFTGGALDEGESCTFSVTLQVPANAPSGSHSNTTSNVLATVSGVPSQENPATDDLDIVGLTLTKSFTDDPVFPGASVNLEFTITNSSQTDATSISFRDNLDAAVDNMTFSGAPTDPCGAGSTVVSLSGGRVLLLQNGSLAAGTSCTFSVSALVPSSTTPDTYVNRTELFSAVLDGQVVLFKNATDLLVVADQFLVLTKEFTNDPVAPGGTVNLRFTLSSLADDTITGIAFTDNMDAALSGMVATGLPQAACGGTVSGTSTISLSGGSLAAGASCTFDVSVAVPADAQPEVAVVNTTSEVSGTLGGFPVTGDPAIDELSILVVSFTKSFGGEAPSGGTVELTFTIANVGSDPVSELQFSDDLNAVIPGLAATSLPSPGFCGPGSEITGSTFLIFTGGSLLPGGSCTFSVTLQIPAGTEPGEYENNTSELLRESGALASLPTSAILTVIEVQDSDGDGVLDGDDFCDGTVIPEGVPTVRLGVNRFALVDGDGIFDTTSPNGNGPGLSFTIEDTAGCSCEQIIAALGLGNGHTRFGCSISAMQDWVSFVNKSIRDQTLFDRHLRQLQP